MLEMQLFMNKRKKERQNRMMEGDKITTTTTWSKNLVEHTPTRWEKVGNGKGGKCKGQGKVAWRRFSSSISSLVVSESGIY